jgi:hypothetical protein
VTDIWEEFGRNRAQWGFDRQVAARTGQPLGAQLLEGGLGALRGAIGTPAQIRDLCRSYADAGIDQLILVSQAGRNQHEHICESLELFARQVMPEFQEEEADREAAKAERLAPAIAAALDRKDPPRPAPEHVIPAAAQV